MVDYLHRVYGLYTSRIEAELVCSQLLQQGFKPEQLELIDQGNAGKEITPDSDEVRNEVVIDGAIGTAAGAGAGALGQAAIAATNASLFIASPVLGTLTMIGWGAAVGGLVGAAVGAGNADTKRFSDIVQDAVKSGHAALIVYAATEPQTTLAQAVIAESLLDKSRAGQID
jgi:hypothetical protein